MKKKFDTRAIHVGQEPEKLYGSVSLPIFQTSTFKQEEFGEYIFDYSRAGNPTRENLESTIASLEEGKGAVAFGSGMAATSAIMSMLKAGNHIVFTGNVYGGTYRLMEKILRNFGLESSWVDTANSNEIKSAINSNTKMIFIETPTNPMMQLTDIQKVANIAKSKNLKLVVDNTFMSPYFQRPLNMGADIVVHSTTKYLNGHSDVVGGIIIANDDDILEELHFIQMSVGAIPGPFDCWLTQRSLKTLPIRMRAHNQNALVLAKVLQDSGKFEAVHYPGLENHPQHELAKKQQLDPNGESGFGGMLSVTLKDLESARKFVKGLKIFTLAESLGGVESLVSHPATMTHASIPADVRSEIGLTDGLVRLSVGIEHIDDLIEDINNSLVNI